MELRALRVKNLRCLTDTGRVPIRPITVLVGRNSSGKSSFLRAFPLLRQSVETATESPILWFYQALVDFGTFGTAINHQSKDRTITFEFSVKLDEGSGTSSSIEAHIAMSLAEGVAPHGSYVAEYRIECLDYVASLRFTPDGKLVHFDVNGTDVLPKDVLMHLDGMTHLLPRFRATSSGKVKYAPRVPGIRYGTAAKGARLGKTPEPTPLLDKLVELIRPIYNGKTGDESLQSIVYRIPLGPSNEVWPYLRDARAIKKAYQGQGSERAKRVSRQVALHSFARRVQSLIRNVDDAVARFMSEVQYLRPLRATADRSYRIQDLAVTEVDPDGKNLAMFMYSLSPAERESFVNFTREHFGFESKIDLSGLNAEIMVKEPNADRHINLVDIGFGYTEVLPLMAILWSTCCREQGTSNRSTSLLAIEQPELHLHPAHQVKLAHVIANAWKTSRDAGREVKIMVETHSEGIVNGLGDLIEKGIISADDVQLVIFDQDPETRQTKVRLAGYMENGALNDEWPFGFFAPVAD
jgi:predicted ATPase